MTRAALLLDRRKLTTALLFIIGAAGSLAYAVAQPAYSTRDEMGHVDYAYQVWQGSLPDFFGGVVLRTDVGFTPDVQWVSQHPPFFYALLAPVVGPLVDDGRPVVAAMLARGVLIVLAGLAVLAVRWMVRSAFPDRPATADTAALIFALASWLPRQGGAVYNDLPAVIAVSLATGFLFRMLRDPGRRRLLVGMAAWCAAAVAVRFSALPLVLGLLGALTVHRASVRRWREGAIEVAVVIASVLLINVWWWRHNLQETGNIQGSRAEFWIDERGRSAKSLAEVVTVDFWQVMLQQFLSTSFERPLEPWTGLAWAGIVLLLLLPLGAGAALLAVDRWRAWSSPAAPAEAVVALTLLGLVATVVATQISYSMSSGSALPRYFFALTPPASALMAYAFTRLRTTGAFLLATWLTLRLAGVAFENRSTLDRPLDGPQAAVYPTVSWVAVVTVVVATVVVFLLLRRRLTGGEDRRQGAGRRQRVFETGLQ